MKKCIKLISIISLSFLLTACLEKSVLNEKQVTELLNNKDFVVSDSTSFLEDDTIVKALSAHNGKYQIEYYIFKDEKRAKKAYESNKKAFEEANKKGKEKNKDTYNKYVQELSDTYNVLTNVDNTLLYASVNIEYKSDLKKVLKELNY